MPARWAALLIASLLLLGACAVERTERELAEEGRELYGRFCAACHGRELEGTTEGPSFLDVIYAPNHHPDEAFQRAVELGVVPHHWELGPMPPIPTLSRAEVEAIIFYVRSRQQDAGITHDPSHP